VPDKGEVAKEEAVYKVRTTIANLFNATHFSVCEDMNIESALVSDKVFNIGRLIRSSVSVSHRASCQCSCLLLPHHPLAPSDPSQERLSLTHLDQCDPGNTT
jgi:hypothetical protein